ncbi:RagB/SusD family nutrient uptake outer membrane protein [Carboxylicivirga sp. A043]|uniref:RagB/SusD family nutrient uptake outer membrane protein n=1 Tax=Carboxylicivirga litoralis TaxID=2816963 RepID=UPI0021CB54C2|nr:RagB/SusD family nutrient uptake outer membrane protein [Carboxylicivirga sp. A043]MCU4157812.1 RagB/SusD family nutrient uptake outer membrane protein [Carboxylicivirga sp. A043]
MIRNKYILLIVLAVLFTVGCSDDFLDTKPTDAISAEDALSSPDNMMLVLNGLHRQMYAQSPLEGAEWSRTGQSHFMPMFDAMGGQVIHTSPGNGWMRGDLQWIIHVNPNYTTPYNLWFQRYHFIASANSIINEVEEAGLTIDADMNNILGQAYAYRAWAYHQLVMTYAKGYLVSANPATEPGVPLLFKTEAPYTSQPRSSVQAIYDQIEADIDMAITHLKDASPAKNKSHISLNAAYGIKARIALSKGDWSTAAGNAELARQGYPLMNESAYTSGFNTYDLDEVIWGGRVISSETNYYASYFYYIGTNFNGSQNRGNPKMINNEIYDLLPDTDYRKKLWLPLAPNTNPNASNGQGGSYETDPNYDNSDDFWGAWSNVVTTYNMTTGHHTHPYMSVKFLNKNGGTIDPDDVNYMRSSEMYLIEAEAYAMQNMIPEAQAALQALVGERNTAYSAAGFTTQEALMDEVKFQRHVELWGEGFAFHDHIRWDEGLDQTNSGASAVLYQDGFSQAKPSENPRWVWKIPQAEIDANPNLTEEDQNKY